MGTVFPVESMKAIRKVFKNNKSHIIVILVFCEHRDTTLFKILGSIIYCLIGK